MRYIMITGVIALVLSAINPARADETYRLQVDGLACPFCAYGIEKKLNNTDGVEAIDIRINEGLVLVTVSEDAGFNKARAKRIMEEAGRRLEAVRVPRSLVDVPAGGGARGHPGSVDRGSQW